MEAYPYIEEIKLVTNTDHCASNRCERGASPFTIFKGDGFGKNGETLDESELPPNLTQTWLEDEYEAGKPFPSYAKLLPYRGKKRGESRYSWTIDFTARRKKAREDMKPFIKEAERLKGEIVAAKEKLKAVKKADKKSDKIETLETEIQEKDKARRDAENKAEDIGNTVFDLKAVNPNSVVKIDDRTPTEVIKSIEEQGEIIAKSLSELRALLKV